MTYMADFYGMPDAWDPAVAEMSYPMRCLRCNKIHDAAKVEPIQRYSDCTTWKCPNCKSLIDDRPRGWGGSAVKVDAYGR